MELEPNQKPDKKPNRPRAQLKVRKGYKLQGFLSNCVYNFSLFEWLETVHYSITVSTLAKGKRC